MSHHDNNPKSASNQVSSQRDVLNAELFAHLLDRFKETRFIDGTSLLDQTTVAWGTALRIGHGTRNVPMIVAGGGGGGGAFRHGRNWMYREDQTPLSNLWATIARNMDERIESFSDSDGLLEELHV